MQNQIICIQEARQSLFSPVLQKSYSNSPHPPFLCISVLHKYTSKGQGHTTTLSRIITNIAILFIITNLFIIEISKANHHGVGKHQHQLRRVKKRKRVEELRVKHPTPSRAINGLIGEEEQNRKQKRTNRKKQGAGPQSK